MSGLLCRVMSQRICASLTTKSSQSATIAYRRTTGKPGISFKEKLYLVLFVIIGVTSGTGYVYASFKNYNELQRTRAQQNHTG
ncbi:hypothetical protein NP493_153g05024 [Ridgeia piscesae]|uniref:Uncharacterized protein n=1 Tax=Ridgeia piscesae TaxID=27915 RepID=A0AAD9P468_RIDPI|nr:hypothetical protein NP493_153g05024 [Ridgeia piscesae]